MHRAEAAIMMAASGIGPRITTGRNKSIGNEGAAMEQTARNFGGKEIVPNLKKEEFNRELVRKMGEIGLFGCAFPEGMGGSNSGFLAHSIVCEQISTYDSGLRALFNLQAMTVPYTMMEWGNDAVRQKYVRPLVSAQKLGCTCFSEANAGSDIASIEDTLLRLSTMVTDIPEIAELDINPLIVHAEGDGCSVADSRMMLRRPRPE